MRKENVEDAITWLTGTDENGKLINFLYKDITIDNDFVSGVSSWEQFI